MNIKIFGNTNNLLHLLALGLIEAGHEVTLYINRKDLLHRPESKYPELKSNYPEWIKDVSNINDEDFVYSNVENLLKDINKNADLVILNDIGLSLSIGIYTSTIAFLTGSDLTYYASYDSLNSYTEVWSPDYKSSLIGRKNQLAFQNLISRQRDGILNAKLVCYATRGLIPDADVLLDSIGVDDENRMMVHMSNVIDLDCMPNPKNNELIIHSGSRVVYKKNDSSAYSMIDFKGTDVLIKGFSKFINSGRLGFLRMPSKGKDVDDAKELIYSLGIEKYVNFYEECSLHDYYQFLAESDLVCDQFGTSFPGMVAVDAFAMGRPVMANFRNDFLIRAFGIPFPGLNCETEDDVFKWLVKVDDDRSILVELGRKSRQYAETTLSPFSSALQILKKIESI